MKYTYTAVFTPIDDSTEFYAHIPDLPGCDTTGESLEDAISQATDAASCWLVVAEDKGLDIPIPSSQDLIRHSPGSTLSIIQIDTLAYRALTDTKSVLKNVSLPAWMAALADKKGINCSQVLQESLKSRLDAPVP